MCDGKQHQDGELRDNILCWSCVVHGAATFLLAVWAAHFCGIICWARRRYRLALQIRKAQDEGSRLPRSEAKCADIAGSVDRRCLDRWLFVGVNGPALSLARLISMS